MYKTIARKESLFIPVWCLPPLQSAVEEREQWGMIMSVDRAAVTELLALRSLLLLTSDLVFVLIYSSQLTLGTSIFVSV